ncbi:MAG: extracellular solute-binding protein [Lachnospiraceae bacterium]|nr:extracellular solute-binding protein [Lachnospiraceae bacterium]
MIKIKRGQVQTVRKTGKTIVAIAVGSILAAGVFPGQSVCASEEPVTLRVCSWEEYIDLGEWDEEEAITLDNGTVIFGERPLYEEFEDWYRETYGREVRVEYSCFGTNEDLYNQLNMGDTYDLVCPSEYMIMKLIAEDRLLPYSENFYDTQDANNFYINNVSPFIQETLEFNEIGGESWSKYAAGYMWGITGVLYNPALVTEEEASTWEIFGNPKFNRQITLKDNVRDSYFAALGILKANELTDENFIRSADYHERLADMMNDVNPETIAQAQELLNQLMDNVYSLETDSGKADMITGKIVANYQWSGDAVYAMDQADEDDFELRFAVPKESTNLWFDGWVMLKSGIDSDAERQHAAEAFVNFVSRTDNAVRNMYYIGYTSSIAGNEEDDTIYEYMNWCYGADEDEEDIMEYPVGYFFSGDNSDENYILQSASSQIGRQLYSQYPPQDVMDRTAIMRYFDADANKAINQMWINVRCFDIYDVPMGVWMVLLVGLLMLIWIGYRKSSSKRR